MSLRPESKRELQKRLRVGSVSVLESVESFPAAPVEKVIKKSKRRKKSKKKI